MDPRWRSRFATPMALWLAAGAILIAASLWLPWAAAARTARIEQRAEHLASILLAACAEAPHGESGDRELLLARFWRLAAASGEHIDDLEVLAEPLPGCILTLRNKHFAFQLAVSPLPPDASVTAGTQPTREVLAWPLAPTGPAHCVFFQAEDAPRAYTRNLTAGYVGLGARRPVPGAAQADATVAYVRWAAYRGQYDERWILH